MAPLLILINMSFMKLCAKFGAFIRPVTIISLSHLTIRREEEHMLKLMLVARSLEIDGDEENVRRRGIIH